MRKIFSIIMVIAVCTSLMNIAVAETEKYNYNKELYFEYNILATGDAEIWFLKKSTNDVFPMTREPIDLVIPEEMNGHDVISIAFHGINGDRILSYSIESITIPKTVVFLDDHAAPFSGCRELKAFIVDEKNPVYTAIDGVLYNKSTKTLVKYPMGKTDEEFVIPEWVKHIAPQALQGITVKRLAIPAGMETMDGLINTPFLQEIQVEEGNRLYSSRDGVLFDGNGETLLCIPGGYVKDRYDIPEGVTAIAENALGINRLGENINPQYIKLPSTIEFIEAAEKETYSYALALTEEAMSSFSSDRKNSRKLQSYYRLFNPQQSKGSSELNYLEELFPALKEGMPLWIEANTLRGDSIPDATKKRMEGVFEALNLTPEKIKNDAILSAYGNVWADEYPYVIQCQQLERVHWPAGKTLLVEDQSLAYYWAIQNGISYEVDSK